MVKKRSLAPFTSVTPALPSRTSSGELGAGNSSEPAPADMPAAEEQLTIGHTEKTQQSLLYVARSYGFRAAAESAGAELICGGPESKSNFTDKNNDIENLITLRVDALLSNAVGARGIASSMASADGAGIPVVTVDWFAEGTLSHIAADKVPRCRLVGDALLAKLDNEGVKIIEIQGDTEGDVGGGRSAALKYVSGGVDSVEFDHGANTEYIRPNAATAMQDLLKAQPDGRAVRAHNDDMALGALQVLEEKGRTDVLVLGVDGLMEEVEAISGDDQDFATSWRTPISLGAIALDTTIKAAIGKEGEEDIDADSGLLDITTAES